MFKCLRDQKGLTMAELLIAMSINLLILAGVVGAFITQQRAHKTEEQVIDMQTESRLSFLTIIKDLRMAGYLSGGEGGSLKTGAITKADTAEISYLWDPDDDGTRETITIRMSQSGDALYDVDIPRLLRLELDGTTTTVKMLAENVDSVAFEYFGSPTGATLDAALATATIDSTTGTQTNRDSIRAIRISLVFRTKTKNLDTSAYRYLPLTAVVSPRNLNM